MAKDKITTDQSADPEGRQDLDGLARQYVDLWQQQLAGAASDEALAGVMAQTVQLMNAGAAAMASLSSLQPVTAKDENNDRNGGCNDGGISGSPAITASPGIDDTAVDELHRRIEQLEKRIAALEAGTGGKRT